jgi:hypothetical protein
VNTVIEVRKKVIKAVKNGDVEVDVFAEATRETMFMMQSDFLPEFKAVAEFDMLLHSVGTCKGTPAPSLPTAGPLPCV